MGLNPAPILMKFTGPVEGAIPHAGVQADMTFDSGAMAVLPIPKYGFWYFWDIPGGQMGPNPAPILMKFTGPVEGAILHAGV